MIDMSGDSYTTNLSFRLSLMVARAEAEWFRQRAGGASKDKKLMIGVRIMPYNIISNSIMSLFYR